MKKLIITLFMLILSMNIISAQTEKNEICTYLLDDLKINEGTKVPNGIPFNNEIFNLYTIDGQTIGHIEIQKKEVSSINCENTDDATYDIKIESADTLKEIMSSEKPIDELNRKIKEKEIIIEGKSSGKKMKGFFTKIGLKVAGWFN